MSVTISGTTGVSKVQANTVDTTELVDDAVNAAKLDSTASPEFAGVYLGGTGAANYLDDYEEGTFTATLESSGTPLSSVTYDSTRYGHYTKIGNTVHFILYMMTDSVVVGSASGTIRINGLPFNITKNTAASVGYSIAFPGNHPSSALSIAGTQRVNLYYRDLADTASISLAPSELGTGTNANHIYIAGSYETTS